MVPGTLAGEICTMLGFRRASDAEPALVLGQMDQDGILTLRSTSVTLRKLPHPEPPLSHL